MADHHLGDDDLELYAMERLPGSNTAAVEEHLLACEECRVRLAGWDGSIRAMRAALHRLSDRQQQAFFGRCRWSGPDSLRDGMSAREKGEAHLLVVDEAVVLPRAGYPPDVLHPERHAEVVVAILPGGIDDEARRIDAPPVPPDAQPPTY